MKILFSFIGILFTTISFAQAPELVIPRGHSDKVSIVVLSPDNKMLASGSGDKTVRLWDMTNGKLLKTLNKFSSEINAVAFSPDGKKLVASSSHELRINDISLNAKEIFKQDVHFSIINSISFSDDGKLMATNGTTEEYGVYKITIWNFEKMTEVKTITVTTILDLIRFENNNELTGIKYAGSEDGKTSKTIIFHINFNADNPIKPEWLDRSFSAISPNGKWAAANKGYAKIDITNLDTKQTVKSFQAGNESIQSVAFSSDSRYLAVGALDNHIFIYDMQNMKLAATLTDKMWDPESLVFSSDNKKLVSGNRDKNIRVWDIEDQKLVQIMGGVANVIDNVILSPSGTSLAISGKPGYGDTNFIQILDLKRGVLTKHYDSHILGETTQYSTDGKYLVAGSFDNDISIWNLETSEKSKIITGQKYTTAFAISADNKLIVSGDEYGKVPEFFVNSFPSGEKIHNFSLPSNPLSFVFAKDGKSVYIGLFDKALLVDIETGKTLETFSHSEENNDAYPIVKLVLDKNGSVLITGDGFGHIRWWNAATGKEIGENWAQEGIINNIIIMPDAKQMITCGGETNSVDTTIKIFNINSRKVKHILSGHSNSATSLTVSNDGKFLFSGSYDRTVILWDLSTNEPLAKMVFFGNTDWIIVDNDGRFDGTVEGMKKMYYVKGLEVMPLESGFENFYTPNLLPRILQGEHFVPQPVNIVTIKDAPKVKIAAEDIKRNLSVDDDAAIFNTTKEQVTIKVQADCPNDGVTEIRLFQNGKLVETTRNLLVEDENKSEKSLAKTFTVTLGTGDNRFKAIAFNTERTESKPAEITVNYRLEINVQPVAVTTTLHLIVVGVNTYKNPKYSLNYALADATAIAAAIPEGAKNLFSKVNSIFLKNEEATKAGITAAFEKIKAVAKPQDLFIFYYAGHGTMNDKNEFFLVPYDVTQIYGNDGALAQNGFSAALLKQMSKDIKAQKQLFILDACQSAGALEEVAGARGAPEEKAIAQLARATGTYWLTASSSDQFASEFSQLGHGSFTWCLLQALNGDAGPTDKNLTVKILDAYLQSKVPEITQKYKGTPQYPVSFGYGNDFPFIIVK